MDDHAEGQEPGNARAISKLDWPTPEMLAAAHRARGLYLRGLVVALVGRTRDRLRALLTGYPLVGRTAKVPIATRR